MDGGRGREATPIGGGRLADPAGGGGGLRALVLCDPASCVSTRGDSAASAGPVTAAGAGTDRDPVPVLRRRVPVSRQCALLRSAVPDPGPGAVPGLRARGRARPAVLALRRGREAVRLAGEVLKHIHLEIDALLVGEGARCLVVDADADLDEGTGALAVDAGTIRLSLRTNGGEMSGGGPYVTVGPVETD